MCADQGRRDRRELAVVSRISFELSKEVAGTVKYSSYANLTFDGFVHNHEASQNRATPKTTMGRTDFLDNWEGVGKFAQAGEHPLEFGPHFHCLVKAEVFDRVVVDRLEIFLS